MRSVTHQVREILTDALWPSAAMALDANGDGIDKFVSNSLLRPIGNAVRWPVRLLLWRSISEWS